jgi:hypothetical protein
VGDSWQVTSERTWGDRVVNTWLVHANQQSEATGLKQNKETQGTNTVAGLVGKSCRPG